MTIFDGRFQTMNLEDGETVVRLRGGRGKDSKWKSDSAHAGGWGPRTSYVVVPCRTQRSASQRASLALASISGLENRSGDVEVLLLGPHETIDRLITEGPEWCRALRSRKGMPRTTAQVAATEAIASKRRLPRV